MKCTNRHEWERRQKGRMYIFFLVKQRQVVRATLIGDFCQPKPLVKSVIYSPFSWSNPHSNKNNILYISFADVQHIFKELPNCKNDFFYDDTLMQSCMTGATRKYTWTINFYTLRRLNITDIMFYSINHELNMDIQKINSTWIIKQHLEYELDETTTCCNFSFWWISGAN